MDHKEKMHKESVDLDETVLDIQQRQKRAQIMRRNKSKIERAREIAKKRMAPEANIRKRAFAQARQIIRRRVAGSRGAEYEKLGPTEKMAIDRAVEGKQKLIKKLALRLIPRVKQAESKRLSSFMQGQQLHNQGQPEGKSKESSGSSSVKESLDRLFNEAFPPSDTSSAMGQRADSPVTSSDRKMPPKGKSKNPVIIQHNKFQEEFRSLTPAFASLFRKSEESGINLKILGEVYNRGWNTWKEDCRVSQQQYAFARVNSYINQGKTYFNEDADLHEISDSLKDRYADKARKQRATSQDGYWTNKNYISQFPQQMDSGQHRDFNVLQKQIKKDANVIRKRNAGLDRVNNRAKPSVKEDADLHNENFIDEKRGLWDNIHAKRKRIKAGSGERMRKPGTEGAPTDQDFKNAQESVTEGLWANINDKRKRIKAGSGERMRPPGTIPPKVFKDASGTGPMKESYDVGSKHYKALTDLDLNTKNRDMTTQNDGYGPLNPMDKKGSKVFWEAKAKMWNTTPEAAMEARCGNCAAFNQSPAIMKKMAEGLGPAGEKIQDLANLGFCELFEFKCAAARTCNKWLVNGPITEEDTGNGASLVNKVSNNSKVRKKIEVVDRKPPFTGITRQSEIQKKVIDEKLGNVQKDPKKREIGTDSLVKAYKADTPFSKSIDESFNIAFAAGVGITLTAADLGMRAQGGFSFHPSVIEEVDEMDEEVRTADTEGVVVHTASGKTIVRKQKVNRKIIRTGNLTDGKPDDTN
jgi:hypothetical protein